MSGVVSRARTPRNGVKMPKFLQKHNSKTEGPSTTKFGVHLHIISTTLHAKFGDRNLLGSTFRAKKHPKINENAPFWSNNSKLTYLCSEPHYSRTAYGKVVWHPVTWGSHTSQFCNRARNMSKKSVKMDQFGGETLHFCNFLMSDRRAKRRLEGESSTHRKWLFQFSRFPHRAR